MAKTKISEYSSTASNNTDVDGINIAEGMAPSNVNNAMREIMAQLKDWQSGAVAQDMYVNGAFTASGNAVFSADLSVGDDLTVTGDASVGGAFTCTGAAVLSSNLSISGTLAATGATSLGPTTVASLTCSGAAILSSTLTTEGNANLKGNVDLGSATTNLVTLKAPLSVAGSRGANGYYLTSRGSNNTPQWTPPQDVIKVYGTFSATTDTISATYTQNSGTPGVAGTTITISGFASHGLSVFQTVYANFTTGTGVDGWYTVYQVLSDSSFTLTGATSLNTSGDVQFYRRGDFAGSGIDSIFTNSATVGTTYGINFSTAASNTRYIWMGAVGYDNVNQSAWLGSPVLMAESSWKSTHYLRVSSFYQNATVSTAAPNYVSITILE